jgi:DNA-binding transcriptional regulator YiaG
VKPIQVRYLLSVTGYSYEKASKELGCTKQSMYNWASGRTKPSIMAESILKRWAAEKKIDIPDEDDIEEIDD